MPVDEKNLLKRAYTRINAETIDRWNKNDWEWGRAISHEVYEAAQRGVWDLWLTPVKPVPHAWLGNVSGKKVLGLASGGGQQMPVLAAMGAEGTVLDYSESQLQREILVSHREGYPILIVKADMTDALPFPDESFDLVFNPVSVVYIENVFPLFQDCFRILKPGGVLLAGLDNGLNFLFDDKEETIINSLPFNPLKNPEQRKLLEDSDDGFQFSHTIEDQIGGQLKAGFVLEDLYEDTNGRGNLHERHIPTFIATKSRKPYL